MSFYFEGWSSFFEGWGGTEQAGGGRPWKQKWRQELVDLLEEKPREVKVPARVTKAIQRVLEKDPPDDAAAIDELRNELDKLQAPCKPLYVRAMRVEAVKRFDEEEVILLLLH